MTATIPDLCCNCDMCGATEWCRSSPWDPGQPSCGAVCRHPDIADPLAEALEEDDPPPAWCPLRKVAR